MLTISPDLRKVITDELRFVAQKMREVPNASQKLYFFSAAFGVLHRVFNIEFDPELLFAHQVLNYAHTQINARLQSTPTLESHIQLPEEMFEKLAQDVASLADCWDSGQPIDSLLSHVVLIGYLATGNGYYLFLKGKVAF